jgi:hypothetical protein
MMSGDFVTWAEPVDEKEARALFYVVEVQGSAALCKDATGLFSGWAIEPTMTYRVADLIVTLGS